MSKVVLDIAFEAVDGSQGIVHLIVLKERTYRFLDLVINDEGVIPPA